MMRTLLNLIFFLYLAMLSGCGSMGSVSISHSKTVVLDDAINQLTRSNSASDTKIKRVVEQAVRQGDWLGAARILLISCRDTEHHCEYATLLSRSLGAPAGGIAEAASIQRQLSHGDKASVAADIKEASLTTGSHERMGIKLLTQGIERKDMEALRLAEFHFQQSENLRGLADVYISQSRLLGLEPLTDEARAALVKNIVILEVLGEHELALRVKSLLGQKR